MSSHKTVLPGATLGVMGGGQLGRMFAHAAQQMGYFVAVVDPDPASPAGLVAQYHIETDYLDEQGLAQLLQRADAVTTEFENVPYGALYTLAPTCPQPPAPSRWGCARTVPRRKRTFSTVVCRAPRLP